MGVNKSPPKMGRPPNPADDKRNKDLEVRVSINELRFFKRAGNQYAKRTGRTYSDWVRMLLTEAAKKELEKKDE